MDTSRSRHVIVAGAGIAGLSAALAFAQQGFFVHLFERRARPAEAGAGIQLSPNATRLLERLGALAPMRETAVRPPEILLRNARTLRNLARIPVETASQRFGSPYIVVHRSDLQAALLAAVAREPEIRLVTDAAVRDVAVHRQGVTVSVDRPEGIGDVRGLLLVGADGVWSTIRRLSGKGGASRFTGTVAWRRTIEADHDRVAVLTPKLAVGAYLSPGFHLVAYPVRGGSSINLAAFTRGPDMKPEWTQRADLAPLQRGLKGTHPALRALGDDGWTAHPLHVVDADQPWVAEGGVALIGDAAHALTPFAAQGAAMAIEDAVSLAIHVGRGGDDIAAALAAWEKRRRPRLARVRRRGSFNRMVWHAAGPVAWARDLALALRPAPALLSDLDWLYGHDAARL